MYSPSLAIGVRHIVKNIDPVKGLIDRRLNRGTKVGTEAWSYPLTHRDYMEPEAPDFFDGIAEYAISKGGVFIPLQKLDDFIAQRKLIDDPVFRAAFEELKNNLRTALERAGYDLSGPRITFDFDYMKPIMVM